jgi:nucleotide-binding universal stress UspA family protein
VHAPHVKASVVMPGHIGTSIVINSSKAHGRSPKELTEEQLTEVRLRLERQGVDVSGASDDDLRVGMQMQAETFRDAAPTTAAQAATIILDGVRQGRWRILVGDDAAVMDRMVREHPEDAYEPEFLDRLRAAGLFSFAR